MLALALWRGLCGLVRCARLRPRCCWRRLPNPVLQEEDRAPLSDIVLLVVDESASQGLSRPARADRGGGRGVKAEVAALPNTELRVVPLGRRRRKMPARWPMTALAEALAEEPRARVAGAILMTDGQVHDLAWLPTLPAPLHVLLTGHETDWDRRLIIKNAPAFAILGEEVPC